MQIWNKKKVKRLLLMKVNNHWLKAFLFEINILWGKCLENSSRWSKSMLLAEEYTATRYRVFPAEHIFLFFRTKSSKISFAFYSPTRSGTNLLKYTYLQCFIQVFFFERAKTMSGGAKHSIRHKNSKFRGGGQNWFPRAQKALCPPTG